MDPFTFPLGSQPKHAGRPRVQRDPIKVAQAQMLRTFRVAKSDVEQATGIPTYAQPDPKPLDMARLKNMASAMNMPPENLLLSAGTSKRAVGVLFNRWTGSLPEVVTSYDPAVLGNMLLNYQSYYESPQQN